MYNMEVESELFKGKTLVAQHRMVNQVRLKRDIKKGEKLRMEKEAGNKLQLSLLALAERHQIKCL